MQSLLNIAVIKRFLPSLILLVSALILHAFDSISEEEKGIHSKIEKGFDKLKIESELNLNRFLEILQTSNGLSEINEKFRGLWNESNQQIVVLDSSSQNYIWTGNEVPIEGLDITQSDEDVVYLKNGHYYFLQQKYGDLMVISLTLIQQEFPYENDYLKSQTSKYFPKELKLIFNETSGIDLIGANGKILSEVNVELQESNLQILSNLTIWLLIFSLISLVIASGKWIFSLPNKLAVRGLLILGFVLFLIRQAGIYFRFPEFAYQTRLFSPQDYATSSWLPSLGDFFINALLLFILVHLMLQFVKRSTSIADKLIGTDFFIPIVSNVIIVIAALALNFLVKGLIINSSIPLDFNEILSFNFYSILSVLIIAMLFGVYYFLCRIAFIINERLSKWPMILSHLLVTGVLAVFYRESLFPLAWSFVAFWAAYLLLHYKTANNATVKAIALILIYAFAATWIVKESGLQRMEEKQKVLAVKLSEERDPIAEFLYLEVEEKIINDELLKTYLEPANAGNLPTRDLAQLYFNGYWDKYSIEVNIFGVDECPLTNLYSNKISDPEYFERLIDSISIPTPSRNFYYLDNSSGRISYLAKIPIKQGRGALNENLGTIFVSFDSRNTPEEIGYPELLLDKIATTNLDPANFSNARYKGGKLTGNFGNYIYTSNDAPFISATAEDEFWFVELNNYKHLVYRADEDALVITSFRKETLLAYLTPFSYLFVIFALLVLLFTFINEGLKIDATYLLSFKRKVQLSVLLTILFALIMIGSATIYFIIAQNEQKNDRILNEKVYSVLNQLEQMLGNESFLNPYLSDDISFKLARLSNTFFSDINIYDPKGKLYASSRKKVFEEGLLSKKMNPSAYATMAEGMLLELIQSENIGSMQYRSAYVNLRNHEGELLGFVNLPYFARQSELRKEISGFLVAIININVFLLMIVVIIAILISNTVTEPLRLIQEKLGAIRLTANNAKIEWKGNDEIADLVKEYNRMVEALSISAEMLARSERESAWREMAKQVAHEIKNPLTPMKLSLQHLKRAYDDGAPDMDERLERFTNTMIEQIESLSQIATAFSSFAKMPKIKQERIDVNALLKSVCDFHKQEAKWVQYQISDQPVYVIADKEQMLRVFNNLIKNAIQATDDVIDAEIIISLERSKGKVLVKVQDNGHGVPENIRDKIFEPNFTTKSSGMGLGLALVKNIVDGCDGAVWFESNSKKGTTFYLALSEVD